MGARRQGVCGIKWAGLCVGARGQVSVGVQGGRGVCRSKWAGRGCDAGEQRLGRGMMCYECY